MFGVLGGLQGLGLHGLESRRFNAQVKDSKP